MPPDTVALAADVARMLAGAGHVVDPASVRIDPSPHGSSCRLYDVAVDDSELPPLFLKDLSPASLLPEAVGVRPHHLYDPRREIAMYERVLAPAQVGPRYFGSIVKGDRALLLVERLDADALDYVGEFDVWTGAAHWIGTMHARFDGMPADDSLGLLRLDGADLRFWIDRAVARSPESLDAIAAHVDDLASAFDRLPRTLVHGELFASNLLVDRRGGVYPVDWELAAMGPGVVDIAALASGGWSSDERERLVAAYAEGAAIANDSDLARAVDLARLYLAVRLVGWADLWTPPADEQHDWAGEARAAFERLTVGQRSL
jgi:hypothetical protein